ncbi:MAG: lipopolysaccharide heptosyltransferase II [Bryobacterales bacterium]
MRLLVRATNWLGDAVMSIPALREIRRARPEAEITILARQWVADLYAREDFCDRILIYDNAGSHRGLRGKGRLAAELGRERFDEAILLQNAFDAALLAWLARIPKRTGYARDGRRALLTQAIPAPKPGETPPHQRFYYLELLRRAGWIEQIPECADIRLHGVEQAAEAGRALWRERGLPEGSWIGVSPGAAYGGAKRWIPAHFAQAASMLASELGARVAVFGSKAEAGLARSIAHQIGPEATAIAGETSLAEYIELAATCSVYLTNDSGPMHVAAALGVPTVAIFGATDHIATGPSASWARVLRRDLDCTPCLLRECPLPEHLCMLAVTPEMAVTAARELLAG